MKSEGQREMFAAARDEMVEMVAQFNAVIGVARASFPALKRAKLRAELIREEAAETIAALEAGDMVETIDGICDLVYVALGAAYEFGVDLAPHFLVVHEANMTKAHAPVRADGKRLKPPGFVPPQAKIREILISQGWTPPGEDH